MVFFKKKYKAEGARADGTIEGSPGENPGNDNPRAPRYRCVAHVTVNGFDGMAALRNVSVGGFRMESRTYAAITVGERYTMTIQPEEAAGLDAFELEVEVRWVQSAETSFNAGFLVIRQSAGRAFAAYINYIEEKNRTV
jgi:hypothetical protein